MYKIPQKKARLKENNQPVKKPKYLKWLHEVKQPPCAVCNTRLGINLHHVKRVSSDPKNDTLVIPLCYNHHLGTEFSAHGTPRDFREEYPYDIQKGCAEEFYEEYLNEQN